jgi:predicted small lipoprotein YifL
MRTRTSAFVLVLLLVQLAGCGGGGEGSAPPDDDEMPPPTFDARIGEMLEDCLLLGLGETQSWVGLLQSVIQGQGTAAGFTIPPGGVEEAPDALVVRWEYDADGDMAPDAMGDFSFWDDMLMAVQPFDQMHVDALKSDGIDALGAALATLPDGHVMRVVWNSPQTALLAALADITFVGGAPAATTGNTDYVDPSCRVRLQWADVAFSSMVAVFPTGVFDLVIDEGPDQVIGPMTTNGTATATLVVARNGGENENWNFGLGTGIANPE